MENFIMFCKTFAGDYEVFDRLFESIRRHNREDLKLVVSCPQEDLQLFEKYRNEGGVTVISDESYAEKYMTDSGLRGLSKGYINQEICKLAFHETKIAENYLCLDSDAIILRDFSLVDFMYDEHTPYSVLIMDKDLACEREYQAFWDYREKEINKIFDFFDCNTSLHKTCHGLQILNIRVLEKLKEYCQDRNFDYIDMINYSPFEFSWYNAALQKFDIIPVVEVEPIFKSFHFKNQYLDAKRHCMDMDDWARQYVGIVMNSNWSRDKKGYRDPSSLDKFIYKVKRKLC